MSTKEKVIELRKQNKTIPEICKELNISKGTVGYHLKDSKIIVKRIHSEETKKKIGNKQKGIKKKVSNKIKIVLRKQDGYENPRRFDYTKVLNGIEKINSTYYNSHTQRIKKWIFDKKIKEYQCEICSISEYNNKKISLELDHIDGNMNNNKLENLRILCPNCHSQTDTYKGKNIKYKI